MIYSQRNNSRVIYYILVEFEANGGLSTIIFLDQDALFLEFVIFELFRFAFATDDLP